MFRAFRNVANVLCILCAFAVVIFLSSDIVYMHRSQINSLSTILAEAFLIAVALFVAVVLIIDHVRNARSK